MDFEGNTPVHSPVVPDGVITKLTSWWQDLTFPQALDEIENRTGKQGTSFQINWQSSELLQPALYPAAGEEGCNVRSTRMWREARKRATHQHD